MYHFLYLYFFVLKSYLNKKLKISFTSKVKNIIYIKPKKYIIYINLKKIYQTYIKKSCLITLWLKRIEAKRPMFTKVFIVGSGEWCSVGKRLHKKVQKIKYHMI